MVTKDAAELELVGGNLALDLANTTNGPRDGEPTEDFLRTPKDLVAWARHAGGLTVDADEHVLADVRRLRAAVYAVFRALAQGNDAAPDRLAELVAWQRPGRLVRAGDRYEVTWDRDVVGPLADAAVDLLRHGPLDRLKLCDACPWLFLDSSRNHSRRWCSMNECGSRRKMRRYRERARARRRSDSGSSA